MGYENTKDFLIQLSLSLKIIVVDDQLSALGLKDLGIQAQCINFWVSFFYGNSFWCYTLRLFITGRKWQDIRLPDQYCERVEIVTYVSGAMLFICAYIIL